MSRILVDGVRLILLSMHGQTVIVLYTQWASWLGIYHTNLYLVQVSACRQSWLAFREDQEVRYITTWYTPCEDEDEDWPSCRRTNQV